MFPSIYLHLGKSIKIFQFCLHSGFKSWITIILSIIVHVILHSTLWQSIPRLNHAYNALHRLHSSVLYCCNVYYRSDRIIFVIRRSACMILNQSYIKKSWRWCCQRFLRSCNNISMLYLSAILISSSFASSLSSPSTTLISINSNLCLFDMQLIT